MSEHIGREIVGAGLPPKTDRATELAIPHPAVIAGESGNRAAVWQSDRRPRSLAIDFAREEECAIELDRRELFVLYFKT